MSAGKGAVRNLPGRIWVMCLAAFLNRATGFLALFSAIFFSSNGLRGGEIVTALLVVGVAGVAGSLCGGKLADTLGEYKVLTYSTLLNAPALLVLALTDHPVMSVALAAVSVGLSQAFMPGAATVIAHYSTPATRVTLFAFYRIFINVGSVVAPAIAGFVGEGSFDTLFLLSAVFSLVTAGILFAVRIDREPSSEHNGSAAESQEEPSYGTGGARVIALLMLMALTMAIYAQHQSSIPLRLTEREDGLRLFSMLLILNPVLVILLELPLSFLSRRLPWPVSLGVGVTVTGIGLSITGAFDSVWAIFFGYAIFTVGECLFAPMSNTAVASIAPAGQSARYQGYLSAVQAVGVAAGPAAGTAIYFATGQSFWPLLAVVAIFGGLTVIAVGGRRQVATASTSAPQDARVN